MQISVNIFQSSGCFSGVGGVQCRAVIHCVSFSFTSRGGGVARPSSGSVQRHRQQTPASANRSLGQCSPRTLLHPPAGRQRNKDK